MKVSEVARAYAIEAGRCSDVEDMPAYLKLAGIFAELAIDVEDREVASAEELQDFAVCEGGVILPYGISWVWAWRDVERWEELGWM